MKAVTSRGAGHARPKSLLRKGLRRNSSRALSTYRTSQKSTMGKTLIQWRLALALRLQLSVSYMLFSSTSAPMADVISIILVQTNMIATSLMIQITLRIVLSLCLTNHCTPTCNTDVSRTNCTVLDVEFNLCECHCFFPCYALSIY